METKRLMLDHAGIKLEARCLQALPGTRMTGIQDRDIILFSHLVDCCEEAGEVLLSVNVLFTMSRKKDVLAFLQTESGMNVGSLYSLQILS